MWAEIKATVAKLQDAVVKQTGQGGLRTFVIAMIPVHFPMVGESIFTLPLTAVDHDVGGVCCFDRFCSRERVLALSMALPMKQKICASRSGPGDHGRRPSSFLRAKTESSLN